MQEQTPSSKWLKWLASLSMITLLTILQINFVKVWQSSQTCRCFLIWRRVPGAVFTSPNAMASFLLWWHKWDFFFFHIMQNKFNIRHIPCIMHEPWQSLQFCTDFNHLRAVLIIYYNHRYLTICFNAGVAWLFLHTSFLSLLFNILVEMAVATTSIDV